LDSGELLVLEKIPPLFHHSTVTIGINKIWIAGHWRLFELDLWFAGWSHGVIVGWFLWSKESGKICKHGNESLCGLCVAVVCVATIACMKTSTSPKLDDLGLKSLCSMIAERLITSSAAYEVRFYAPVL
jgi:hypothetical protein